MIRSSVVGWAACLFVCLAGVFAWAQEPAAAELYGRGVHAYFRSDYEQAIRDLTLAIEKNQKDPRAYFFRGAAIAQVRGFDAANADFVQGAKLEADAEIQLVDVDVALERIQGPIRQAIEQARRAARAAAKQRELKRRRARYTQMKQRDKDVLFVPSRPIPKIGFPLPKPKNPVVDPFASGLALTGGKIVQVDQPLADDKSDGAPAVGQPRDPFGGAPATQPAPAPKAEPDPFGSMPAAASDDSAPKADQTDPFGDDSAKPKTNILDGAAGGAKTKSIVGQAFGILGKTLSGGASRDPFGAGQETDAGKPAAADAKPAAGPKPSPVPAPKKPDPSAEDDPFK